MAFKIPNEADAGVADQAEPDSVDFDILTAGIGGDGVVSGCVVTAQATPDMTVAVAAGSVRVGGTTASVSAGNITITAADPTNARFDLIVVNNSGVKSAAAGTASANPVFPAIPANSIVLAAVHVPAGDTAIQSGQIIDKRVILPRDEISRGPFGFTPIGQSLVAAEDWMPVMAWRLPASGEHGTWRAVRFRIRVKTAGTGTNSIKLQTSTTLTGARTDRVVQTLANTANEEIEVTSFTGPWTPANGEYLWVVASAIGATAPKDAVAELYLAEQLF